jgi:HEAT repeat protein
LPYNEAADLRRQVNREEGTVPMFGPPDVAKIKARGNIEGLIRAAKYDKDPAIAAAGREALTEIMDTLIQTLSDRNLRRVFIARQGLALIGKPAVDRLIFILNEGHVHRREDAAHCLGEIGDPEALPALVRGLRNNDPLLRLLCARAIGKIGVPDPAAMQGLLKRTTDANKQVAGAAVKAYALLGGTERPTD